MVIIAILVDPSELDGETLGWADTAFTSFAAISFISADALFAPVSSFSLLSAKPPTLMKKHFFIC